MKMVENTVEAQQTPYTGVELEQVAEYKPVASVDEDKINVILRKSRYNPSDATATGAVVEKELIEIKDAVKNLTYQGRGLLNRISLAICYALGLKDPYKELDKKRAELEVMLEEDDQCLEALEGSISSLESAIEEKKEWLRYSMEVIRDREARKNEEEKMKAFEEQKAKECEQKFYESNNDREKAQLAQLGKSLKASIKKRTENIKKYEDETLKASISFNQFYDAVEDRETMKSGFEDQKYALELDKQVLEGVCDDLRFLCSLDNGAMKVQTLIAKHQGAMRNTYGELVKGLNEIYRKQGKVAQRLPGLVEKKKKERKIEKESNIRKMQMRAEDEVRLAKERIAQMSGII